jgi:hypothetical protein
MKPQFRVGQKVLVRYGGSTEHRKPGTVVSIKTRPELITYEVRFPEFTTQVGMECFYMAEYLVAVK